MAIRGKGGKILTNAQIKSAVKRATGWDDKKYKNEYDKFRNRVKNYATITQQDVSDVVGSGGINELFYKSKVSEKKYGADYRPSALLSAIQSAPSTSTGRVARSGIGKKTADVLINRLKTNYNIGTSKKSKKVFGDTIAQFEKELAAGAFATPKEAYNALRERLNERSKEWKNIKAQKEKEATRRGLAKTHYYGRLYE